MCPDYDLCVQCFAQGKSSGSHEPWHDYMVIEQHAYPIFEETWGADEELLLIEGLKSFGVGNWQDVADHIGGRTKEEVKEHYMKIYMDSPKYPVPDLSKRFQVDPGEFIAERRKRIEEYRRKAKEAAAAAASAKAKPISASVPSCHEVQGYMPGRLEFEVEYENEAEVPIKDMIFEPDDSAQEVELKIGVLNIYNSRLTSRAERKRTMFEHGLLEYRKNSGIDKKRSKEERELVNRLKPFVRVLQPEDYKRFLGNILTEVHCRRRIAELQEYRRNGIRTFAAAAKYENDKAVRHAGLTNSGGNLINGNISQMMILGNGSSRHTSNSHTRASSGTPGPSSHSSDRRKNVMEGSLHPVHHSTVSAQNYMSNDSVNANSSSTTSNDATDPAITPYTTAAAVAALQPDTYQLNIPSLNTNTLTPSTIARLSSPPPAPSLLAPPLDISRCTDVELLSAAEQLLCSHIRVLPKPYLAIKETLFREVIRNGGTLTKTQATEVLKIDQPKAVHIWKFFKDQKWIS